MSNWISVKDRLPDDKDKYLVLTSQDKQQWTGCYNLSVKPNEWLLHGWTTKDGWHPFEVTHWQPLPEPPKGVDNE